MGVQKNWLVKDTTTDTNFYQLLYQQFGSPTTADFSGGKTVNAQSEFFNLPHPSPYYVTGALTVDGSDWSVGAGQTIVVFVNGNLTIKRNINITGSGFAAFIVNGNITVDPSVGSLEGIYITSPSGIFDTGTGAVRLVGTGSFVAGNFTLQRDVGDLLNPTTSSELFIYNPQLLLTMPDQMKQLSVQWQEIAP